MVLIDELSAVEIHAREFDEYIESKTRTYSHVLKTVTTLVTDRRCILSIISEQNIQDLFDESDVLSTIFDEANRSFSQQQYFTDIDGLDFGNATIWENPSMTINGQNRNYQIKRLLFLEAGEEGHDFDYKIFVMI